MEPATRIIPERVGAVRRPGAMAPGDEALVLRARDGDVDAFDELARQYRPMAVGAAARIVGRDRAEDVAQDALLLAFRAVRSVQSAARFPFWLLAITRFRAFRMLRKEARFRTACLPLESIALESVSYMAAPPEPPDDAGEQDLRDALARVGGPYADVLRLRFFDGLSPGRIAGLQGVPVSTVRWRCFRGKELLGDILAGGVRPARERRPRATSGTGLRDGDGG